MENKKPNKYFFCKNIGRAKEGRVKIAIFLAPDQKNQFATTYFYIQEDLINERQIKDIEDNFCKTLYDGDKDKKYLQDERCEQEFLKYINSLNIDLYIFQSPPFKKARNKTSENKKFLAEIHSTRSYLTTFPQCNSKKKNRINYCYYMKPDILSEDEKNYIKESFCNQYGSIKDDDSHDEFLKYFRNKNIYFELYDDNRKTMDFSNRVRNSILYNLNGRDLEKKINQENFQAMNIERKIFVMQKFKFGSFATCSQEANQYNRLW